MNITAVNKASLLTATLALTLSGVSNADNRDDIENRIKKVGILNIATITPVVAPAANSTSEAATTTTKTTPSTPETTEESKAPEAVVAIAPEDHAIDAEALYTAKCFACHGTGAAGAPIVGNAEQWALRIAQDKESLYSHAIGGFNTMPPKGAAMDLADDQIKAIVDFMVLKAR